MQPAAGQGRSREIPVARQKATCHLSNVVYRCDRGGGRVQVHAVIHSRRVGYQDLQQQSVGVPAAIPSQDPP